MFGLSARAKIIGAVQGHLGGKSGSRGCPIGSVIRARALILGVGTSLLVSTISWRNYRSVCEPDECQLIERCLAGASGSQNGAFRESRPGMLLAEIGGVSHHPELAVAALNDALGDVDSATRLGVQAAKKLARASLAAGIAGALAELATNIQGSDLQAVCWGLSAVLAGLVGTLTCAVIGHRAMLGFARRRRLWDAFAQWILKLAILASRIGLVWWQL